MTSRSPGGSGGGPESPEGPLALIVDDNQKNLKLARDVLRAGGFRTLEAETGAAGLALAAEELPDVVLMDLRLPDMDGAEAARAIAGNAQTTRIPVVALTALPLERHDDWLVDSGFAGYLEKPINIGTFADQVRRYCARAA